MKTIKYILSTFLIISVIWSCTKDNLGNSKFMSSVVAPSEVDALFNATQDNSGNVTIIPSSIGGVNYDVYFGDSTTEPAKLEAGESVTHTYAEAAYEVKVVAYGITGLISEVTLPLNVSFNAPSNVVIEKENDAAVSYKVNIKVTADDAISYDVYFGEPGNDDPVSANVGDWASYTYAEAGIYTIRVVVSGAAIETTEETFDFEATRVSQPIAPAQAPPSRIDTDVISVFSDAYTPIDGTTNFNPGWGQSTEYTPFDLNGDAMLQYSNLNYQGIEFGSDVDAVSTSMEYVHLDVWTSDLAALEFTLISHTSGEKFVIKDLVAEEWSSFDIPLSEFTDQGLTLADLFQIKFVGSPWAGDGFGTIFVDNIYFWKEPSEFLEFPISFESENLNYPWEGFGNFDWGPIPVSVIDNPDQSGINLSSKVVEISKPAGAQTWAGANMAINGPIDFSSGTTISLKVWSPRAGVPILFKLEDTDVAEVLSTTTVAGEWEELTFDLTQSTIDAFDVGNNYNKIVIFPDFGNMGVGEVFYFDDIEIASVKLPLFFEAANVDYPWEGFGNFDWGPIPVSVIDNPDQSGINFSSKVVEISKPAGAQTWAGANMAINGPLDFSSGTTISLKVWSPRAGVPILFKLEDTDVAEVLSTTTVAGEWEELTFDLTQSTIDAFDVGNNYNKIVIFPDFGNMGVGEVFYFDDIIITN